MGKKARVVDRNSRWVYLGRYDINLDHNNNQIQRHQFKPPPGPTSQSCEMEPYLGNSHVCGPFRPFVTSGSKQSKYPQHLAYRGSKYTRCDEEVQGIVCIAVGVGANRAQETHRSETGATNDDRSKRTTIKERTKLQSSRHKLTRFHETAHNLLSHHVVSLHKTQHPSIHCSGFNTTNTSCQSPTPPHKTYTLQQVKGTGIILPSKGGVVAMMVAEEQAVT